MEIKIKKDFGSPKTATLSGEKKQCSEASLKALGEAQNFSQASSK